MAGIKTGKIKEEILFKRPSGNSGISRETRVASDVLSKKIVGHDLFQVSLEKLSSPPPPFPPPDP